MKPDIAETEGRQLTEGERVVLYRAEELERAGYSRLAASALAARRDVDLHLALWLPRKGCPHNTAIRILL
jgi:hypothetical protein